MKSLEKSSIGKSTLVIDLAKTSFEPGEPIEGTVMLRLGKPTKSKGVSIALTSGESRRVQKYRNGKRETVTEHYTKVWHSVPLDDEKEYPAGQLLEYPFKLMTPSLTAGYDPISSLVKWVTKDKSPPG